jgi:undecaprenyl diphosphate synthase
MKELDIEVNGRVQAVGFRRMIKKKAEELELVGYVFNKESGEVVISVQGAERKLNEFLEWIRSNPGFTKIEGLRYNWYAAIKPYNKFEIVRDKGFFSEQFKNFTNLGKNLLGIDKEKGPVHLAVIPDGNRRWAKSKGFGASYGHYRAGNYQRLVEIIKEAEKLGVMYITFWGFSTENWKRDKKEIDAIFNLVLKDAEVFRKDNMINKIKFKHIGRKDRMPKKLVSELKKLEEETRDNKGIQCNLCLDYGGREEILTAVNSLIKKGKKKINEKDLESSLYTCGIPDPDLIIRTSGEQRTSGFLPFQSVYAELYFSKINFPDFDARELRKAVDEYKRRKRRFGS